MPQSIQTRAIPFGTTVATRWMAPPTKPMGFRKSNIRLTRSGSSSLSRGVTHAKRQPRLRPSRIIESASSL